MPRAKSPQTTRSRLQVLPGLLHAWYLKHHRAMPWRARSPRKPDAYHVLLSELMLQQTQVATVIPYFERFVGALPTLKSLARADEQTVLKLWQGLGYYSRARNLHRAAQAVVQHHQGRIPDDPVELRQLPGIGPYTAGAIASIAYNRPAALVDGNVARVLIRLEARRLAPSDRAAQKWLWSHAGLLVETAHARGIPPGDFNQALMELGATCCTPRTPDCPRCPLKSLCEAHRLGLAESLPLNVQRPAPRIVRTHIMALQRGRKLVFRRRPARGLWAGLWEMPSFEGIPAARLAGQVQQSLGLDIPVPRKAGCFTHLTTHRKFQVTLWKAPVRAGRLSDPAATWKEPDRIDDLPLATVQQRALRMLQSQP